MHDTQVPRQSEKHMNSGFTQRVKGALRVKGCGGNPLGARKKLPWAGPLTIPFLPSQSAGRPPRLIKEPIFRISIFRFPKIGKQLRFRHGSEDRSEKEIK